MWSRDLIEFTLYVEILKVFIALTYEVRSTLVESPSKLPI
jgi:hypothetical protein